MRTKRIIPLLLAAVLLPLAVSCSDWFHSDRDGTFRRVFILYSAGFNNLSPDLSDDIRDLTKGYVPKKKDDVAMLVVSHQTADAGGADYKTETEPCLFRIYRQNGSVVCDTLFAMPAGTTLLSAEAIRTFLQKAADLFPSDSYGMVVSGHGNGWLPVGFYANPSSYGKAPLRKSPRVLAPELPLRGTPGIIRTKSFGPEVYYEDNTRYSHEIDIEDMAAAIPVHLDYLLFDACLMGGVEVAWALRNVTDRIGFCQAETLTEGFNYKTMGAHLLQGTPDPQAVCKDFFDYYDQQSGLYRSATISLVRTAGLPALAAACTPLFEQYRTAIAGLSPSSVQNFGGTRRYFYDLEDILTKAGATDTAALEAALDGCIEYKANTGQYYSVYGGQFPISAFSGLTMYLPSAGTATLDAYYRQSGWGSTTGLVR